MTKEQKTKEIIAKIRKGSYEDWVQWIGEGLEEHAAIKLEENRIRMSEAEQHSIRYLKIEYHHQIEKMRKLGLLVDEYTFEQCVNTVIAMAVATNAPASYTGPAEGEKDYLHNNKERIISEYKQLMNIIYDYVEKHPHISLGESMIQFTVDRAKKYDEVLASKEPEKKDLLLAFAEWLDDERNKTFGFLWRDNAIWSKENAFEIMLEHYQNEPPAATNQEGGGKC